MRRTLPKVMLALATLLLAAALADRAVGWLGLDWRLVEQSLHYNQADVPLYRWSDDPVLHYHMSPGATHGIHAGPYDYDASVNRWGARGEEHPTAKPPGTTRILYFGASSIFGANVSDHQTLPARLEEHLESTTGLPVEVWNFGHSAYVGAQIGRLAQRKLDEVAAVDLVLVTVTNVFPRPFLPPWPVSEADNRPEPSVPDGPTGYNRSYFERDPSHWAENFRSPHGAPPVRALHGWALRLSPSYRCLQALTTERQGLGEPNHTTEALAQRELTALEALAAERDVMVVWVNHPSIRSRREPGTTGAVLELWQEGQDPDYYEIHPRAQGLDSQAFHLARMLVEQGLVPAATGLED